MNQQYRDILTIIERHGPITTGDICEKLTTLGYGGAMSWQYFRDSVAKQLGYLKNQGDVTGEDKPQTKGKPLRYWSLAKADTNPTLEMASDVVEAQQQTAPTSSPLVDYLLAEATAEDSSVIQADKEVYKDTGILMESSPETVTPDPTVSVEVKAAQRPPISVSQALDGKPPWINESAIHAFMLGIEFAEKHHGIGQ